MQPYAERLVPSPAWWLGALVFGVAWGWLCLVLAGPTAALVVGGIVFAAGAAALWFYGGAVVLSVDDDGLRAGRAVLPHANVGEVEVLDAAAVRAWHGPRADARAWLVHRAYVTTGVRIVVDDPADPTPYWLVSSRHPQELHAALEAHRGRTEPADQGGSDGQA